jgi:hypothetical protein
MFPTDKATHLVIVHLDDVGINHGPMQLSGIEEAGICTAGSVMMPCPWFPEVAQARQPNLPGGEALCLLSQ